MSDHGTQTDEPGKVFDKYKQDNEHNNIVGLMVQLIGIGLGHEHARNLNSDDALYINYLLEGLRR